MNVSLRSPDARIKQLGMAYIVRICHIQIRHAPIACIRERTRGTGNFLQGGRGGLVFCPTSASTMNFATYSRLKNVLNLMPADKRICGNGDHPVKVHGLVRTPLVIANKEYEIMFIALESA